MDHVAPRGLRPGRCVAALVLALVLASPAAAQPVFEGDEVVVAGSRPQPWSTTPATITVITAEEIKRLGYATLADLLRYVAEVQVLAYGGYGQLATTSVRGSGPAGVLVLIDGVPLNGVMLGLVDLSTISLQDVERVEILRGPFSAIHGSGALGGVVNVVTRVRPRREAGGTLGSGTGAALLYGDPFRGGAYQAALLTLRSPGYRLNGDAALADLSLRVAAGPVGAWRLTWSASRFQADVGVPGPTFFPSPLARQAETRSIVSLSAVRSAGAVTDTVHAYWIGDDLSYLDPTFAIASLHRSNVAGFGWQRTHALSPRHVVVFGVDVQAETMHSTDVGDRAAVVAAAYVQDERVIGRDTLLAVGLRYDLHSIYGGQLNPRAGVVRRVSPRLTLRAGVGRTFRGPSFGELYFAPFGNPSLRPESGWAADLSVEYRVRPALLLRVSAFWSRIRDLIRPDASFVAQNIGRARITGLSVELEGILMPRLAGRLTYTWMAPLDLGLGLDLRYEPRRRATAALLYDLGRGRSLGLTAAFVGARFADQANIVRLPAYAVLGLHLTLPVSKEWGLRLSVENLTNAQYEPVLGYPAPGRTGTVTLTRRF